MFCQTPGGVSTNLVQWLKADAGTSSTIDGEDISSWNDQSGTGSDATQASTSVQPSYIETALNNNPGVSFSSTDYMEFTTTSFPFGSTDRTLFVVLSFETLTTNWQIPYAYGNNAGSQANGFGYSNAGKLVYFGYGSDVSENLFLKASEGTIYTGSYDGTTAKLYAQGESLNEVLKT